MKFSLLTSPVFANSLDSLPAKKLLINTINAHSYNVAQKDKEFAEALEHSDVLLPDGISIVFAIKLLKGIRLTKIAGADLFMYEMNRLDNQSGRCFFLGSSESTLERISEKIRTDFPNVLVSGYSPPFKPEFTTSDNKKMISLINQSKPDVLFIGMTAPKQEKWAYIHFNELEVGHICCIGAVFDFYSGKIDRAPKWIISLGLEWFFRLIKEPRRLWRRYLIGNSMFIWSILKEKINRRQAHIQIFF